MRKGLLRAHWLLGLFLLGAVGCATDQQQQVVSEGKTAIEEATKKLGEINSNLIKVVTIGKEKKEIRNSDNEVILSLDKAQTAADDFVKISQKTQVVKGYADRLSAKVSPESKKEMRDANRGQFEQSIIDLNKTGNAVIVHLAEAEYLVVAGDPGKQVATRLKKLRDEIKKGRDKFEVLTKRR